MRNIHRPLILATQSIPRNYVIDKQGKIVYQGMGYTSEEFAHMIEVIKTQLK
ncbi:MAG: hypothetical protein V1799_13780 [bacterium]